MKTTDPREDKKEKKSDDAMLYDESPSQDMGSEEFIGEKSAWSEDISQYRKENKKNERQKK